MIYIPISQLESGMILAAPVRHPKIEDHVLLQAGFRVDADSIKNLHRFSVVSAWIRHPSFDFLDRQLSDDIPHRRARLYESVKQSFSGVADKTVGAFDLIEYRTVVGEMIMAMVANRDNAVWAERLMDGSDELFSHSANVAYLSLVIGMRIKEYVAEQRRFVSYAEGADLTNLGIGAMLHDLGKLGLDRKWWNVHGIDAEANSDEYRSHAERGYRAVQGRVEATSSQVLLHHHQRFDGSGFPTIESKHKERAVREQKGSNIHVFNRIVAVANVLDALISAATKRGYPLITALAAIQRPALTGVFDPIVLDAALRTLPPFPLGASVTLSDERQAVVTGLNELTPCQPVVRILQPADADANDEIVEVDLSAEGSPAITRIMEQPVNPANFYTLEPPPKEPETEDAECATAV